MLTGIRDAEDLGQRLVDLIEGGQREDALRHLDTVLHRRTPFRLLDRVGAALGRGPLPLIHAFLEDIAAEKTMGGWVVIGAALRPQIERDLAGALARARTYIVAADVWYGADILGERVPGPALIGSFEPALSLLGPWREDADRWVRRSVGVAVHFWAKRSRSALEKRSQAAALLSFLEPMFEEWQIDAVKGVGWGLKTVGKHYPQLMARWLEEQVVVRERRHRALMLRKAMTYLPDELRAPLTKSY